MLLLAEVPPADPVAEILLRFGTPVFYGAAALGVALLAYGFFSKSDSPARRRCTIFGGLVVFLMAAVRCQLSIDTERGFIVEQDRRRWMQKFQKFSSWNSARTRR